MARPLFIHFDLCISTVSTIVPKSYTYLSIRISLSFILSLQFDMGIAIAINLNSYSCLKIVVVERSLKGL